MNGMSAFMVMISPLVVAVILYILSGTDTAYGEMEDYLPKAMVALFAIQSFVMVVIMYRMYDRLAKHSLRDRMWMENLITVCESRGADVSGMRDCYEETLAKERFAMRPLAIALLILMTVFTSWALVGAVSRVESLYGNQTYVLTLAGSTLIAMDVMHLLVIGCLLHIFVMEVLVFIPSYMYPYRHEERQVRFTQAMTDSVARLGIVIKPMELKAPPVDVRKLTIVTVLTAGYSYLFLMFRSFNIMNSHLMNQWDYEAKLLVAVESKGRYGFEPEQETAEEKKGFIATISRWYSEHIKPDVGNERRMPPILIIAELFLLFLLGNYYLKLVTLGCVMSDEIYMYDYTLDSLPGLPVHGWHNLILVYLYLYFIMLMIDSILGIASRKAPSWRKVVRCCFTVVVPLWYSAFVTRVTGMSHLFDFNVFITTAVLYDILLMMFVSESIKRYYTPIGYKMPGMWAWVKYALWGDIFTFVVDDGAVFAEDAYGSGPFPVPEDGSIPEERDDPEAVFEDDPPS